MKTSALIMAFTAMAALSACSDNHAFGRGKVTAYLEGQGYAVLAVTAVSAESRSDFNFCAGSYTYYPFSTEQGNGYACINQETGEVSLNTLRTPPTVTPLPTED